MLLHPIGCLDGMGVIRKLLHQASQFLKPDGVLLLEVDDSHTDVSEFEDIWTIHVKNDSFDKNRFWIVRKKE
jgi:methylase of polypeptide subunit release factors